MLQVDDTAFCVWTYDEPDGPAGPAGPVGPGVPVKTLTVLGLVDVVVGGVTVTCTAGEGVTIIVSGIIRSPAGK